MTLLLAIAAVLFTAAGMRELQPALAARGGGRLRRALDARAVRLGLARRIVRAGVGDRYGPRIVLAAKLAGAIAGAGVALLAQPAAPARLVPVIVAVLVAAGFFAPDVLLERAARRRRARFVSALPDALDMLAVGVASGRNPATVLSEIAAGASGTLALELGATVAEIECGIPAREAIARLRDRVPAAELGPFAAALDRSRAYGSPLGEQLHQQATALRREARRRITERAARAAPKIQLVVALLLVPSVLLVIVAAVLAHADRLFGAL